MATAGHFRPKPNSYSRDRQKAALLRGSPQFVPSIVAAEPELAIDPFACCCALRFAWSLWHLTFFWLRLLGDRALLARAFALLAFAWWSSSTASGLALRCTVLGVRALLHRALALLALLGG